MGCNNSKTEENTHERSFTFCWRKRNKVEPINVPVKEKFGPSLDAETSNTARKTEHTALMQLKQEGIIPRKGEGGVAFVLEIGSKFEFDHWSPFAFPGTPEYRRKYPQYETYSREACLAVIYDPPRRLPPINTADIDKKQERARLNRQRAAAERRAKWARSYARVQASMKQTSDT